MQRDDIHIIEFKGAQDHIISSQDLKDEIDIITGAYAIAYIPIDGAVRLSGSTEGSQFKFGLISFKFSHCQTTYSIPVHYQNLQGYLSLDERIYNYNKQVLFKPLPLFKKLPPGTFVKIKYRDWIGDYRFMHHIKLFLTYKEK